MCPIYIVLHVLWGHTYSPANLSDCWKQFSLPERQCPHTCNMTRNYLQPGHAIPTRLAFSSGYPSISNWPSLRYSKLAGTWLVILPSCHITRIWKPVSWTKATHSTGVRGQLDVPMPLLRCKRLIECINKGGCHIRYKFVIITCLCPYFYQTKLVKMGWHHFY